MIGVLNFRYDCTNENRLKTSEKVRKREIDFIKEKKTEHLPHATIRSIGPESKSETFDLTTSRVQFGSEFKRGIADAQRARKMLLASFSS